MNTIMLLSCQFALHYHISRATSIIETASLSSPQGDSFSLSSNGIAVTIQSSSAGDFNGDGYEDLIIALPTSTYGGLSLCGTVYVVFGTANGIPNYNPATISTPSQAIMITGPSAYARLGSIVSGLGDVNDDGIDDIILLASSSNQNFVIFGKNNGQLLSIDLSLIDISSTNKGIVITSLTTFGQVGSAGDFNGDGINDFMVSFPLSGNGIVFVIFGKNGISTSFSLNPAAPLTPPQGIQVVGKTGAHQLGQSLSKAGDFNNDGIDDIMIGTTAFYVTVGGLPAMCGMVVVIYGTKTPISTGIQVNTLTSNQGFIIIGKVGATIGYQGTISSGGDLNNDGINDLVLGSQDYSASAVTTSSGMAYIIYGKTEDFSDIDLSLPFEGFKIIGEPQLGWNFGDSATSADINGDGLSDLIVGLPGANSPIFYMAGRVYVFFGNKKGFSDIDLANQGPQLPQLLKIYGNAFIGKLGMTVRSGKDFNKDGAGDFLIVDNFKLHLLYGSACQGLTQCGSPSLSPICYASKGCACGEYGLYFFENKCVSQCPQGYYAYTAICESCPVSCSICTSSTVCQACNDRYIFSETGTTCEPTPKILSDAATALDSARMAISIATIALTILDFTNPGPIVIVSLSEVFLALRLMKINYPPRLEYMIENAQQKDTVFDQLVAPPGTLVDHMANYPLPEKFEEVGFYSSFLVNFWPSLIIIVGVVTLALVTIFINACITPNKSKTSTKTKKIALWLYHKSKQAVRWNLLISTLTGCFGDMGMFTALELKTLHFNSVLEGLSFCICLLLNIMGIFIQIILINIIWKLRKAHAQSLHKKNKDIFRNAKKKLEGYEVIFEVFKEDTFLQQSFLFLFNFKIYTFFAVISYFPDSPFVSTLVNSIIGLLVLLYLALVRPHKEKIEFASLFIAELLYEIMNICTFLLALDDTYDLNFGHARITLGDVIIVCNCTFMTLVSVFLAIQIFSLFKDTYNFIQERTKGRNMSNSKSFTSIEQASFRPSSMTKSVVKHQQQFKNSNQFGLEPNLKVFERSRKKERAKNSLAIMQNLDDSEIAQIQHDNMDHRDNDSPLPKIKAMRFLRITKNDFYEDRQRRQGNQDPVKERYSKEQDQDQSFHAPVLLLPAKRFKNYRLDRPNN